MQFSAGVTSGRAIGRPKPLSTGVDTSAERFPDQARRLSADADERGSALPQTRWRARRPLPGKHFAVIRRPESAGSP